MKLHSSAALCRLEVRRVVASFGCGQTQGSLCTSTRGASRLECERSCRCDLLIIWIGVFVWIVIQRLLNLHSHAYLFDQRGLHFRRTSSSLHSASDWTRRVGGSTGLSSVDGWVIPCGVQLLVEEEVSNAVWPVDLRSVSC